MKSLKEIIDWKRRRKDLGVCIAFLASALLLAGASLWAYRQFIITPPYVDPERYPIRGIDVSRHNGLMNLDAAARDGIEFIFIKASEGGETKDPNFRLNYDKARHAGMKIGAYHFFRFDRDGVTQAMNLHDVVRFRHLDLGVAIDVERHNNATGVPDDSIRERLAAMIDYLHLRGYRVTLYSNAEGYYDLLHTDFRGAPLWICSFKSMPINREWDFWQYYHHGKVAGIRGDVDLNVFSGSRAEWEEFLAR